VSETISQVTTALEGFRNENLGLNHITREHAQEQHSRRIFACIFEESDPTKLFLEMDGTYVFVEKSGDFAIQQMTWSMQKNRNLVKPFMIILPSGYILDAVGPWFANGKSSELFIRSIRLHFL